MKSALIYSNFFPINSVLICEFLIFYICVRDLLLWSDGKVFVEIVSRGIMLLYTKQNRFLPKNPNYFQILKSKSKFGNRVLWQIGFVLYTKSIIIPLDTISTNFTIIDHVNSFQDILNTHTQTHIHTARWRANTLTTHTHTNIKH
jgi:hypothetical protein